MSNQKEKERAELHKTIWQIANDLRGSVDGWDFKQYVLGMLFYRFISENLVTYLNKNEKASGNKEFSYEDLSDDVAETARKQVVDEKGFFILPSELFSNVAKKAKSDDDLNVTLENIFKNIEKSAQGTESEDNLKGLFDDIDVNSNKLGGTVIEKNDKLRKLISAIDNLKLGKYEDNTIDAFGDAYEYLMTMYAANAGKSGGEFFTPQEVSELLAKLALIDFGNESIDEKGNRHIPDKKRVEKVYDPACGSGSLLLKFAKILGKDNVKLGFFGQEINLTTYNLARINMFLHDINFEKFDIAYGDTLKNPVHWDDKPFEAIVSNPPYSTNWAGDDDPLLINDERFSPAGVLAPRSRADFAFVMHILSWLSAKGTASIIEFPGVLYRRDNTKEPRIRKFLVENNYVDSVIQMPADLFFGNNFATAVIILRKNKNDNKVLFVDASNEFVRIDTKNKLTPDNIKNIVDSVRYKKNKDDFAILVDHEQIVENEYNLSVNTYLKKTKVIEEVDVNFVNNELFEIESELQQRREIIKSNILKFDNNESEIDILLKKYYPNGVPNVKLGKVCDVLVGGDTPKDCIKGLEFPNGDYQFPVYSNSKSNEGLYGYSKTYRVAEPAITVTSIGTIGVHFIRKGKFTPIIRLKTIIPHNDKLDIKYLYYVLYNVKFNSTNSSLSSMNANDIKKAEIPLPNLDIQRKIVTILDEFTKYEELMKEEVKLRLEQYEYYRNKLLTF